MQKSRIRTIIISMLLTVSIIGTTIDWSFLGTHAEDSAVIVSESVSGGNAVDNHESISETIEEIPTDTIEQKVPETFMETSAEVETTLEKETLSVLHVEQDGIIANFRTASAFAENARGTITMLSDEDTTALADMLSETFTGKRAVPTFGFTLNISPDMEDVSAQVSMDLDEGVSLYNGTELISPVNGFYELTVPGTYLAASIEVLEDSYSFTYTDDEITVTAVCLPESKIPKDAKLSVHKIEENSNEYKEAYAKLLDVIELTEDQTLLFAPYDVSFLYNDIEIEPEDGIVSVTMAFTKKPIFINPEEESLGDLFYAHIKDNGTVELPEKQGGGGQF